MAQILCQCGKKVATIHVTEIIDGEKNEIHLCEDCAKKKKLLFQTSPVVDLSDLLSNILEAAGKAHGEELHKATCSECGITFEEFRSSGRFGCPNDYEAFRKGVDPLLERIHGTTQHHDGGDSEGPSGPRRRDRLAELRTELKKAVEEEAYERAARIRDQIYALKKEQGDAAD